jgi:putative hemolysin
MTAHVSLLVMTATAFGSLLFSTVSICLRSYSRSRLEEWLERRGKQRWFQRLIDGADDLTFATATGRLLCNIGTLLFALASLSDMQLARWAQYGLAFVLAGVVTLFTSVVAPHVISRHAAEAILGLSAPLLFVVRVVFHPVTLLVRGLNRFASKASGPESISDGQDHIEEQILTAVEAGEKEGVVDEQEREMIESVIEFRDTTVGQIMTARPDIIGLETTASLDEVKDTIEKSGHSRLPVYEETLDKIVGILYARDLLPFVGENIERFDMKAAMRPAFYVPETKPLRDLLQDFRLLKVHMAIVLDEYGGTAGLVTIEDVLEELVGEISDEHEPQSEAMVRKVDERAWEVDARIELEELNRLVPLSLPEDADYHTLGGFVSTLAGRVPERGALFSYDQARFVVLECEPQRVVRVRIELEPAGAQAESA